MKNHAKRSAAHGVGWLSLALLAAAGCSSKTEGPLGGAEGDGTVVDGTGGGGALPGTMDPSTGELVLDSGRTVLRRLTRAEYRNTVRDLLAPLEDPTEDFTDADTVAEQGFDSIGAVLTTPPVLVEQYEAAATELIDQLFARPASDAVRGRVLSCDSADDVCARTVLEGFAHQAFRRPLVPGEVDRLLALKSTVDALELGEFEGLKAAMKGTLLSPHFLFRVEKHPVGDTQPAALSEHELATRLSYFLWSSMPDEELLSLADAGSLSTNLAAQVERMLDDPKAAEFALNFGGQWLGVRHMEELEPPSALVFPEYDEQLTLSAKEETLSFFEHLYREAKPLTDLLDADYSFIDERLARHYGLTAGGTGFQNVSLSELPRRGVLTQASFLMNSSHPGSTSPARRGLMVLERFMCQHVPPPPPGVEVDLEIPEPGQTRREQLEMHRESPSCRACHSVLDPIGFGFENFDGVGNYRTEENDAAIDASGELPMGDGSLVPFSSPVAMASLLAQDDRFTACVTEKLLTYGAGRPFNSAEAKLYTHALAAEGGLAGHSDWRSWVAYVVTSEAFLTRRGEAQ